MGCGRTALNIGHGPDSPDLYEKLEPGDIVLIKTPGAAYAAWRRLSCSPYDHVAVMLENKDTFNIVYPVAKKLPASFFFRSGKTPLVLRPVWQNQSQRRDFTDMMEKLEGMHYNALRGIIGVINMVTYNRLRVRIPVKTPGMTSKTWICTDATLLYLETCMHGFSKMRTLNLDLFRLGYTSTNDFIQIADHMPDLLRIIG